MKKCPIRKILEPQWSALRVIDRQDFQVEQKISVNEA